MTLLIIGGTGTLGRQIVRKALENGFQVRCIVRNKKAANFLAEWGAELVYGDLSLPESLPLSFQGVTAIIDASTSRPEDDTKMVDVDWYGKLILIEMAKRVNIQRFIFFSIFNASNYPSITLMKQKATIEKVLSHSGVPYTIFQCTGFYQAFINQYAIPILEGKTVWKTSEALSMSYIDTQDAANLCIKSLSLRETENKTFFLGGSKAWPSEKIISLCESLSGQKAKVKLIPIYFLKVLCQFTGFFEWTFKISERLAFVQLLQDNNDFVKSTERLTKIFKMKAADLLSLETYLEEYFEMILVTLENLDVDSQNKQKDLLL